MKTEYESPIELLQLDTDRMQREWRRDYPEHEKGD